MPNPKLDSCNRYKEISKIEKLNNEIWNDKNGNQQLSGFSLKLLENYNHFIEKLIH